MELLGASRWWIRCSHEGREFKVYGELYAGNPASFVVMRDGDAPLFEDFDEAEMLDILTRLMRQEKGVRLVGPNSDVVAEEAPEHRRWFRRRPT